MNKSGHLQRLFALFIGLGLTSCTPDRGILDSSYWSTFDGYLIIAIILFLVVYLLINLKKEKEKEEDTAH